MARKMQAEGRLHLISLPGAVDRQRQVMDWCERYGLSADIIRRGVAGEMVARSPDPRAGAGGKRETLDRYGRDRLQPAECGCVLSHRSIYAEIRDQRISWALILEDDVRPIEPDWPGLLDRLAAQISHSALGHHAWVCHLGLSRQVLARLALRPLRWRQPHPAAAGGESDTKPPAIGQLDPRIGSIWTTHAYLISHRAATSILSGETAMTYVADDWEVRLQCGLIEPMLATLSPLFLPRPGMQSQIPQRTHFRRHDRPGHAAGQTTQGDVKEAHRSFGYRINRKVRTLVYRTGLGSVSY